MKENRMSEWHSDEKNNRKLSSDGKFNQKEEIRKSGHRAETHKNGMPDGPLRRRIENIGHKK